MDVCVVGDWGLGRRRRQGRAGVRDQLQVDEAVGLASE
jgi:hypothetical protein